MSGIMKALLLLTVLVCVSRAQYHSSQRCLCSRTRGLNGIMSEIKDLHVYPQTVFCSKVEIVVTLNDNNRFCLNPKMPLVKRLMNRILKTKLRSSTTATAAAPGSSQSTSQS